MQGNPVKNPGPLFVITYAVLIGCRAFGRKMGTWNGGNGPERVLIFNAGCDRPWNVQVPQPRAVQPRNPPSSLPGRPQCSPEPCNTGIAIVPAASPPQRNGFTAYLQVQAGAPLFTATIASSARCNPENDLPEFFPAPVPCTG